MEYNDCYMGTTARRETHKSGIFIALMCLAALAGCIAQTVSIFVYDWWKISKITYNYQYKGMDRQHLVGPTEYGLETVSYDNGRVLVNWKQRIERTKTKGYNAIQYNSNDLNDIEVFASNCPPSCQEAIATRITGYETIKSMNDIIKIVTIICSVVVILSIVWSVFFGRHLAICCVWFAAATGSTATSYTWHYNTYESWNAIISSQQLPKPVLGNGLYLNLLGAGLYVLAGIGFLITMAISRYIYHGHIKKLLKAQYSELQNNDISTQFNCKYSFAQANPQIGNGIVAPMMNVWSSQNNAVPFSQPGLHPNSNGFWNGPQGNFIPPGI
ncbi:conserved Plasmodium protein, unknown function [Babesia microti strain RI]|uniref:Uncharacterized protein n=1 Tax=Babesia microti (strain RI) TaxID=1133968 RepID=I7JDJ6_BABMR|nr:conserved Plasmodium protein, unknown function [Babesia microti strain RI]CCF75845.1 conserved Plasmodium protein, unknown function [Babesia microti strain RI]|eukprot:XP_012650253.1 conserved Plasmodium protein, unknown function [Babesia microti strain RI]